VCGAITSALNDARLQIAMSERRQSFWFKGPKNKGQRASRADQLPIDPQIHAKIQEIETLTEAQINDRLQAMLEDINITQESGRVHIMGQTLKEKKGLLRAWILRDHGPGGAQSGPNTPAEFVTELKDFDFSIADSATEGQHGVIDKLRVSLSTNGLNWVKRFGEHNGLDILLDTMRSCSQVNFAGKDAVLRRIMHQCVRCLKAFMNNKYGLTKMLQSEQGLIILVSGMDPFNESMMCDVLRVTAAVCLVADGHDRVLEAVTVNGEMCNINRFEPVLMALKKTNNPMLQLACLQFINAIVNTPEDIDFKIHLRNEFIRGGLDEMLMNLREIQLHDLTTHLDIFEDHKEQDFEEMLHRLNDIRIELSEPEEVFKMLRGLTSGTPAGQPFLSILQHLLLVRDDFYARPQYFKLVDKCVSQIVLHKGGLDPDFHYTKKFMIDVDGIVG
jgi:hypothetical protein